MTRQWTREALDAAHPLPRGWYWRVDDDGADEGDGYHVIAVDPSDHDPFNDDDAEVWVLDGGLESTRASIPVDIALAVILASLGMDSLGAMADAMKTRAEALRSGPIVSDADFGESTGFRKCAAMLRRGTAKDAP
jgi:hypothetical protein